jgi:glutamate racemase
VRERPIGVFDSGLGGLTVVQALADLLPHEDLLYLGDTARYPYGERSHDELIASSLAITRHLVDQGAKLVVVACNSATAAALPILREAVDVPVIGVVEPGLRAAAAATRTHRAMVIGTRVTAESQVYERTAERLDLDLEVTTFACPGFVELVEEGRTGGAHARKVVRDRLAPLLSARIDALVLGCTHFPLLARPISEVVGRHVTLVSSADETAFEVRDLLERTGWDRPSAGPGTPVGARTYLTTGDPARFARLGARFLGVVLADVRAHRFPELGDEPLPGDGTASAASDNAAGAGSSAPARRGPGRRGRQASRGAAR